jgi:integrase
MASMYTTQSGATRWRALWRDDNGRQRSKSFTSEAKAEQWEAKMRAEREDGVLGLNTRARETTLTSWLQVWWKLHMENKPLNTQESYARAINDRIDPYIGGLAMAALTTPRIAEWRDELKELGFTAHQIIEAMRVLSSCLGKAVERGLIPQGSNPVRDTSKPDKPPTAPKLPLSPEQVEWIRLAMLTRRNGRTSDLLALRSVTITSVLAYGGPRPSEVMGSKIPDYDFSGKGFWVRDVFAADHRINDTKTHVGRWVELYDPILDDLRIWLEVREALEGGLPRGRAWMFPDEDGQVTRYTHRNWTGGPYARARKNAAKMAPALAAEIEASVPYGLRGSMISVEARAAGRDLDWAALARRAGHSVPTLQKHYLNVVNALANLPRKPAIEQIKEARAKVGTDEAIAELRARVLGSEPRRARLIDLRAQRQKRAA